MTEKGIEEAKRAGKILKKSGLEFDVAYSSVLIRAKDTLKYILKELSEEDINIKYSWKLNERHCGALQGLNKDEIISKYGESQIKSWVKDVNSKPPALNVKDYRHPANNKKYINLLDEQLPSTENLIDAVNRIVDFWNTDIKQSIVSGKKVIIVAHGNILRGFIGYLYDISDTELMKLEMRTAEPICCEFENDLKPIRYYYLK